MCCCRRSTHEAGITIRVPSRSKRSRAGFHSRPIDTRFPRFDTVDRDPTTSSLSSSFSFGRVNKWRYRKAESGVEKNWTDASWRGKVEEACATTNSALMATTRREKVAYIREREYERG